PVGEEPRVQGAVCARAHDEHLPQGGRDAGRAGTGERCARPADGSCGAGADQAARRVPGRGAARGGRARAARAVRLSRDDRGARELVVPRGQPEPQPGARRARRRRGAAYGTAGTRARRPHGAAQRSSHSRPDGPRPHGAGGDGSMSVLVVGSVALDTIETPFGMAEDAVGGSGTFFSAAASLFGAVRLVGVVGDDYPLEQLRFLEDRGVDLSGLEQRPGESFRWSGVYSYDLNSRETRETRLGVFADFQPKLPERFRDTRYVFLGNIDPELQLDVLRQVDAPRLVACDTMNFWISGKREALLELLSRVNLLMVNDSEARELSGDHNLLRAARWIQRHGPEMVIIKKGEH